MGVLKKMVVCNVSLTGLALLSRNVDLLFEYVLAVKNTISRHAATDVWRQSSESIVLPVRSTDIVKQILLRRPTVYDTSTSTDYSELSLGEFDAILRENLAKKLWSEESSLANQEEEAALTLPTEVASPSSGESNWDKKFEEKKRYWLASESDSSGPPLPSQTMAREGGDCRQKKCENAKGIFQRFWSLAPNCPPRQNTEGYRKTPELSCVNKYAYSPCGPSPQQGLDFSSVRKEVPGRRIRALIQKLERCSRKETNSHSFEQNRANLAHFFQQK